MRQYQLTGAENKVFVCLFMSFLFCLSFFFPPSRLHVSLCLADHLRKRFFSDLPPQRVMRRTSWLTLTFSMLNDFFHSQSANTETGRQGDSLHCCWTGALCVCVCASLLEWMDSDKAAIKGWGSWSWRF